MARQRKNDPTDKKARILHSARMLFIEHGFEGTAMSAIAKHSGVTQSMIHHYFGTKLGLWNAVKEEAFAAYLADQEERIDPQENDVRVFIARSLDDRFALFTENRDLARFLSWIQLSRDPLGMETGQETGRQVIAQITRFQESGAIRADIAPELIFAMALSLTTYWFQSRHLIAYFGGVETGSQEADDAYREAVVTLFINGLISDGQASTR